MEQDTSTAERIRENVQVLRDIGTPVQMIKVCLACACAQQPSSTRHLLSCTVYFDAQVPAHEWHCIPHASCGAVLSTSRELAHLQVYPRKVYPTYFSDRDPWYINDSECSRHSSSRSRLMGPWASEVSTRLPAFDKPVEGWCAWRGQATPAVTTPCAAVLEHLPMPCCVSARLPSSCAAPPCSLQQRDRAGPVQHFND